ncbi:lupeol synthase-like [Aegilops tauschii subsp. strangulata]|uniref:Terpene cyclase/mutase family member n=2 Tax=Aegilops tauschii subsp. strangulata TaxID=200361 RepID=A0A453Q9Q0_AEGTS|nr:lupeol synthase-like [Aegilops tauschii subsp. strangulata]
MWKLKIAEGGPWLTSGNNHFGRETWEFDRNDAGSSEERDAVDAARAEFQKNRFRTRHSSDVLARMQLVKGNNFSLDQQQKPKGDETSVDINIATVSETLKRALRYFSAIQGHDGHWPGDFPGPLFTTATMIIVLYVTESLGTTLSSEHRKEICRYLYNRQNMDGGWGLHAEGESSMLSSALNYTALRLLGEDADGGPDMSMPKARKWIHDHGGTTMIPILGKVWLSVLGVSEWSGVNPMPPELFLLPSFVPIQPGRLWSHFRMAFIPMSYLYGKKFVGPITKLVLSLREELHIHPYKKINWKQARKLCAKEDAYHPHTWLQECLSDCLYSFGEPFLACWPVSHMRRKALRQIANFLKYEDDISRYICIGAAQKALSMLCCWSENPSSDAFKRHLARVADFLWLGEDGMKVRVCAGQSWDVAFAVQAILASNVAEEFGTTLRKAHHFIKASQIVDNPSGDFSRKYRHISKGGWAFQVADQGWQVSDCTAEALKALLLLSKFPSEIVGDQMETCRFHDAVNILLSLQNPNGGYGTWELARTYPWMENLNMTEIYADIMVEHQYVECTSSVIQALALFRQKYPGHREDEVEQCIRRATEFIEKLQNEDGSWFGSWGICFTYGTWFAIEGLSAVGQCYSNSTYIRKGCQFLLSKQLRNGGWGESHLSSTTKAYTNLDGEKSHIVNTAWAMLALMKAGQAERDPSPLHEAARLIMSMQLGNGDFPQEEMIGSFLKNGPLCYMAYRNIFPIWALGEYHRLVLCSG